MRMKYVAQLVVKSVMGPMEFVGLANAVCRLCLICLTGGVFGRCENVISLICGR